MKYALLIYDDPAEWMDISDEQMKSIYGEYMAVSELPNTTGGSQLQPADTARSVRVKDGKSIVSDGPFAETKEVLGGFYLIDADSPRRPSRSPRASRRRGWAGPSRCGRSSCAERAVFAAHLWRGRRLGLDGYDRARSQRRHLVKDGPFAEPREQLGAYCLIEADSLDDAIARAERIPAAQARDDRDPSRSRALGAPRIDALARAYRDERARCIAILGRVLGDLDLAEDAVQDAFVIAAERWASHGTPSNPGAWIVATARNRAIDRIRREQTLARKTQLLGTRGADSRRRGSSDSRRAPRADLRLLPPGACRRRRRSR